eukprot:g61761.t1
MSSCAALFDLPDSSRDDDVAHLTGSRDDDVVDLTDAPSPPKKRQKTCRERRTEDKQQTNNRHTQGKQQTTAGTCQKRSQDEMVEQEGEGEGTEPSEDMPSDPMLALALLRAQFPHNVSMLPMILLNQIYGIVKDRTEVDRALDEMCRSNQLRRFRVLSTGKRMTDAVVFSADFEKKVDEIAQHPEQHAEARALRGPLSSCLAFSSPSHSHLATQPPVLRAPLRSWWSDLLQRFCLTSMGGHTSVTKEKLKTDLAPCLKAWDQAQIELGVAPEDRQPMDFQHVLSVLVQAGLLLNQAASVEAYWLAVPGQGLLSRYLPIGRQEVCDWFNKTKHKEMLFEVLCSKTLKSSPFGTRFHVRELLGGDILLAVPTTIGLLVQLPANGLHQSSAGRTSQGRRTHR